MKTPTGKQPGRRQGAASPTQPAEPTEVLCTKCSAPAGNGDRFCPQCGQDLGSMPSSGNASKALAGSASVPSQPAIDGNANAPASRGSEETATSVPPVPERSERACACGQTLSEQALFCQKCGKPVSQAKPRCRLTRLGPDRQGESVVMSDDEFTIGKAPECGLAIQDDYVSRRHARLTASDGMLYVEDLGSSNGTFLRVRHPIVLEAGDEILIGSTVLKVEDISI